MDRFFGKPIENPLQKKYDDLKQMDATLVDVTADLKKIDDRLEQIKDLDPTTAARKQDEYFRETGDYVTIDEMRDTLFEKHRHLRKVRGKIKEAIHNFLVRETKSLDPDKKKK